MALTTISGGGAFTQKNITDINSNFAAITQPDIWVRPQYGTNAGADGSYAKPYATMAGAFGSPLFVPGCTIGLLGVLLEEATAPIVNDVTIVGMGNVPRQATTSSVPNGGGATWLSPSGGTGVLLTLRGQGWSIQNIYFNNSASQPCVQVLRSGTGDVPADPDGSHARLEGCVFTGADAGIQASGGIAKLVVKGCTFFGFVGSGDTGLESVTGAGIGTDFGWQVTGNQFFNNVNHIVAAAISGTFTGNSVVVHGASVTSTKGFDFTGGAGNVVMGNYIEDNVTGAVAAWTGGTNDGWCNYYKDDGVASGVPS